MTTAQDKAIARSADHENLVGELVAALKLIANAPLVDYYDVAFRAKFIFQARTVLAKAEAQQ